MLGHLMTKTYQGGFTIPPTSNNQRKTLLSKALPTRARPRFCTVSPSHQEACTNLLASSIRGQTEEARTTVPQQLKEKISMKKQKVILQMKGQDKTPGKQLNEVVIGKLPEKELWIMIVKMIPDLGKTMEKMQEMFPKHLTELKNKQTEIIH